MIVYKQCLASVVSRPNYSPITGIRVKISGIAFTMFLSPQSSENVSIMITSNLHDHPNFPGRTQFYPNDRGSLSHLGLSWSSEKCFHIIVPIARTLFETTKAIWMIMWKPGFKVTKNQSTTYETNLPASTCNMGCWSWTSSIRSSGLKFGGFGQ